MWILTQKKRRIPKMNIVIRGRKILIVSPDTERRFKQLFRKYFEPKHYYAYPVARKMLIGKPEKIQIKEFKRVRQEYDQFKLENTLAKMKM